jgi:hypothetical protein
MITFLLKSSGRIAAPIRQEFAHLFRRNAATEGNPYSPTLCIALLLIVGFVVKLGPGSCETHG